MGVSFVIGLALLSGVGRAISYWIERTVLGRLPMYDVIKSLTKGFAEVREGRRLQAGHFASSYRP